MQGHAVENDWLAVEQDSRRGRINPDLPQAEAREEVVDGRAFRGHGDLQDVQRGQAWTPQVGVAHRKGRGNTKHRIAADQAQVDGAVQQRLRTLGYEARRIGVEAVGLRDLGRPQTDLDAGFEDVGAPVLEPHRYVGAVEVWAHVGAHHTHGG